MCKGGEKVKKCHYLDVVCVAVVLVLVWGLLSLPVVLYYIPLNPSATAVLQNDTLNDTNATECTNAVPYTGSVCRDELLALVECFPLKPSTPADILVASDSRIAELQPQLSSWEAFASPECNQAARPLLCHHLLGGVCDERGVLYRPTAQECREVSDGVCQKEFELARSMGAEVIDCDTLPEESSIFCLSETQEVTAVTDMAQNIDSNCTVTCREDFFCEGNRCVPECLTWRSFTYATTVALNILVIVCGIIGALCGITVMVTCCFRIKQLFVFPAVFVIYETINSLVLNFFCLVNFVDPRGLYCTSNNLLNAVLDATPYCVVTGMWVTYNSIQLKFWWTCHVTALFLSIKFPFRAQVLKKSGKNKYIHIACVAAGLLLPLVPVVAAVANYGAKRSRGEELVIGKLGFGMAIYPPIVCASVDPNVSFYSVILPNVLLVQFGITMLILSIWLIAKNTIQTEALTSKKTQFKIGTAEKKLIFMFAYFILLEVTTFTLFSISSQNSASLTTALSSYFTCESVGHDPANPCDRSQFEGFYAPGPLVITSFVLLLLIPAVSLLFVANFKEMSYKIKRRCIKKK